MSFRAGNSETRIDELSRQAKIVVYEFGAVAERLAVLIKVVRVFMRMLWEYLVIFVVAGFPSPWRWLRRRKTVNHFNSLNEVSRTTAEIGGIDPESLIKRGLL